MLSDKKRVMTNKPTNTSSQGKRVGGPAHAEFIFVCNQHHVHTYKPSACQKCGGKLTKRKNPNYAV